MNGVIPSGLAICRKFFWEGASLAGGFLDYPASRSGPQTSGDGSCNAPGSLTLVPLPPWQTASCRFDLCAILHAGLGLRRPQSPIAEPVPTVRNSGLLVLPPLEWSIYFLEKDLPALSNLCNNRHPHRFPTPLFDLYSIWWFSLVFGVWGHGVSSFVKDVLFLFLILLVAFVWFFNGERGQVYPAIWKPSTVFKL